MYAKKLVRISPLNTLLAKLDVRFSEAYHLEVPMYVVLAKTPKVSAY